MPPREPHEPTRFVVPAHRGRWRQKRRSGGMHRAAATSTRASPSSAPTPAPGLPMRVRVINPTALLLLLQLLQLLVRQITRAVVLTDPQPPPLSPTGSKTTITARLQPVVHPWRERRATPRVNVQPR